MTTRHNTTEAFHAIKSLMEQGKLPKPAYQVYEACWHNGPLKPPALTALLKEWHGEKGSWGRQLKLLERSGLLTAHSDGSFDVTSATSFEVPKVKKPSAKKFKKGLEDLEMALIKAERVGLATPEAKAVIAWLQSKV